MFFRLIERVKGMEELLLRTLLAGNELHVVEQQQVDHAVFVAKCLYVTLLDGGDQLVGEILALDIDNAEFRMCAAQDIGNCVHQMGFSKAGGPLHQKAWRKLGVEVGGVIFTVPVNVLHSLFGRYPPAFRGASP